MKVVGTNCKERSYDNQTSFWSWTSILTQTFDQFTQRKPFSQSRQYLLAHHFWTFPRATSLSGSLNTTDLFNPDCITAAAKQTGYQCGEPKLGPSSQAGYPTTGRSSGRTGVLHWRGASSATPLLHRFVLHCFLHYSALLCTPSVNVELWFPALFVHCATEH